jgi:2-keto-4-pentenoate hydratase/2-oxohepta-3-ene-1,7-dioic acid hydratase in catechol pathway
MHWVNAIIFLLLLSSLFSLSAYAQGGVNRYVRFAHGEEIGFGILDGENVMELDGDFIASPRPTGRVLKLTEVRLLAPCQPSKVIAVGLNYKSHLGDRDKPTYPGLFAKFPTSIIGPEDDIKFPHDAQNVHYEGELVVVIGKEAKNIAAGEAADYIFGVTAGNDVSERNWQREDLQWFRAKGSDTFAPLGPVVSRGLSYNDLQLQTRVNGEVRQSQRTIDLLFDVHEIVSYVSRYVTLLPGDLIFTGTPGSTQAMKPGDIVEVEIEGVGILRNRIGN